eukprot:SAG31_NODE_212_length_20157_cov_9.648868_26_plen_122_part_00
MRITTSTPTARAMTELRLHWSAQADNTWSQFRPQFELLLPALVERLLALPSGGCRLSVTSGDDVAPAGTNVYIGPGQAFAPENLGAALDSNSLVAVVLPFAGVPPVAVELLSSPPLRGIRL